MIVSASRRCDLPAYRMAWFMSRLREGFCEARNPFDPRLARRVSLLPEDLDCLVFWTRDPRPILRHLEELEARGLRFYLQLSLTAYPRPLEPGAPRLEEILPAMQALAARIGPKRILWRYDPVFFAESDNPGFPSLDRDFHLRNFEALAARIEGSSSRLVLSLLDEYRHTGGRLARAGYSRPLYGASPPAPSPARAKGSRAGAEAFRDRAGEEAQAELDFSPAGRVGSETEAIALGPPSPASRYAGLLAEIAALARGHGLEPQSCAEPGLLAAAGIESGACIDGRLIEELFGIAIDPGRDRGQRPGCRCAPSVDIGDYGPCPTGCVYCYARR